MVDIATVQLALTILDYYELSFYLSSAKRNNHKTLIELALNELNYRAGLIPTEKLQNDLNYFYDTSI